MRLVGDLLYSKLFFQQRSIMIFNDVWMETANLRITSEISEGGRQERDDGVRKTRKRNTKEGEKG